MYKHLEQVIISKWRRPWGAALVIAAMTLLLGYILFTSIQNGITWENDRNRFLILGGCFLLCILLVPQPSIRARRNARKQMENFTTEQLQRIDLECYTLEPIGRVFITKHALAAVGSLVPIQDIIWIFVRKKSRLGSSGKTWLIIVTSDKKRHKVGVKKEDIEEILSQLRKHSPGIYFGDSREIIQLYHTNFIGMVASVRAWQIR